MCDIVAEQRVQTASQPSPDLYSFVHAVHGWFLWRMAALGRPDAVQSQTRTAEGDHPTVGLLPGFGEVRQDVFHVKLNPVTLEPALGRAGLRAARGEHAVALH